MVSPTSSLRMKFSRGDSNGPDSSASLTGPTSSLTGPTSSLTGPTSSLKVSLSRGDAHGTGPPASLTGPPASLTCPTSSLRVSLSRGDAHGPGPPAHRGPLHHLPELQDHPRPLRGLCLHCG